MSFFKQLLKQPRTWLFTLIFWLKNIPQWLKIISAIACTVVVVGSIFYISRYGFTIPFTSKDEKKEVSTNLSAEAKFQINQLKQLTRQINPINTGYEKIKFEDLELYPKGWVKRNFTQSEIANALVSGPGADTDGDGLSNKSEFLFGSNPKNKYTLCGTNAGADKCKLNDRENVNKNLSPLTGFKLEESREIYVNPQDKSVIQSIENSFDTASEEGVDFPTLYQKSLTVDLTKELESKSPISVEFNRQTALDYINTRVAFLQVFLGDGQNNNQLSSLFTIYKLSSVDELKTLKQKYVEQQNKVKNAAVPDVYVPSHKALMLMVDKLVELIDHRISGLENKNLAMPENMNKSQRLAIEIVWSYRKMSDLISQVETK